MNTEEFYKALFERYSFDEDKIRQAAIKQAKQPAIRRFAKNYWKPAVGIAAAVAVTVGVTAYASRDLGSGVQITVSPASALSASERLHEAELNYYNAAAQEADLKNIYITFRSTVSLNDITLSLSATTDTDDIRIDRLYLEDGFIASSADEMARIAENGTEKNILAAKVCAPAGLYRNIQDLSFVYLAEMESAEINDSTFTPIEIDDNDPLISDIMTIGSQSPSVVTTPFSFEPVEEPVPDETEDDEETDAPDMTTSTTLPPDDEQDISEDITEDDENDEPDVEVTEEAAETTAPTTDIPVTELIGTAEPGLMTEIYSLNVPNALDTLLIDNYAVVLTKTEVYVYTLGGIIKDCVPQKAEIASPQITYSDQKTVIVTGCGADGRRNMMLCVNASDGSTGIIDAAQFIGDSEIGTIQYSVKDEKYFVKTIASTGTYIYEFTINSGVSFRPLVESPCAISLAGSCGDMLYFMASNETGKYALCEFNCKDGTTREAAIFECSCSIKSGAAFGSFILIPSDNSGTYIFDTATASIITADVDMDSLITTVRDKTFFKNANGIFVISGGIINEYEARDVVFARKPSSDFIISECSTEKITVIRSDSLKWQG